MLFTLGPWGQQVGAGRDTLEQQVHHLLWGKLTPPSDNGLSLPTPQPGPKGFSLPPRLCLDEGII